MIRIKQLREEFGYTQQELADKLKKAKSTIAMYENETRKPSLKVLNQLSELFNVTTDYLLGKTDIRNETTEININDVDMAFFNGFKDLQEEDKEVMRSTLEAFLKKNKNKKK